MTGMLASVRNLEEARLAFAGGADIVDLKEPAKGALGALAPPEVSVVVENFAGRIPVSATVGDLPMEADVLYDAVRAMAMTGVDFVKIGIFSERNLEVCLETLSRLERYTGLIGVLF